MPHPPHTLQQGALHHVAGQIASLVESEAAQGRVVEIHLLGHSAGAILLGHFLKALGLLNLTVKTTHLWAPACTMAFFDDHIAPSLRPSADGKSPPGLEQLHVHALEPMLEEADDIQGLYWRSFLKLVSRALEERKQVARRRDGEPLLGLAESLADPEQPFAQLVDELSGRVSPATPTWQTCPGSGAGGQSNARSHQDFLEDASTWQGFVKGILGLQVDTEDLTLV